MNGWFGQESLNETVHKLRDVLVFEDRRLEVAKEQRGHTQGLHDATNGPPPVYEEGKH